MRQRGVLQEFRPERVGPSPIGVGCAAAGDFRLILRSDAAGIMEVPGLPHTYVAIHAGASVHVASRRGGQRHAGRAVYGDIDIIPAGTPSVWEMQGADTALLLRMSPELIRAAAEQMEIDPRRVEIRNRFQMRDAAIENIGWALKAEMEAGYPTGRLYLDSMAMSLAARLVRCHSSAAVQFARKSGKMAGAQLRRVLGYIEDNLGQDILLADIAAAGEISVSHCKELFRESMGLPVHQYVIRRRVERAKKLLQHGNMPISQVALESGFAHQSHLARHMRRLLGISPRGTRTAFES
jgi:AraC family transcriptional regulator